MKSMKAVPTLLSLRHTRENVSKEGLFIGEQLSILESELEHKPGNVHLANNIRLLRMKLSLIEQLDNPHPQHNIILQHCATNPTSCGWWQIGVDHWVGCVDSPDIAGIVHVAHCGNGEHIFGVEQTVNHKGEVWSHTPGDELSASDVISHIEKSFHTTLSAYRLMA